jgi:hypothetical protein
VAYIHPEQGVRTFIYGIKNKVAAENFKVQDGSQEKYQAPLVTRPP